MLEKINMELPTTACLDLVNRIGYAKSICEEVNEILDLAEDPVGAIFWWSEPNHLLDSRCPKHFLFSPDLHDDLRRAAKEYANTQ